MSENVSSGDEYEATRRILGLDEEVIDPKMLEIQLGLMTLTILGDKTSDFAFQIANEISIDMIPDEMKQDYIDTISLKSLFFVASESRYLDGAEVSIHTIASLLDSGYCVGYRIQMSLKTPDGQNGYKAVYVAPEMPIVISDDSGENAREEVFNRELQEEVKTAPDMSDPQVIRYVHDRKDQGLGIRTIGVAEAAVLVETLQSSTLDMPEMKAMWGIR